jgi:tryptophan 2,3-dioxygenase
MSEKNGNKAHDEMLFIIVHQTYELWFKQIIYEFDLVLKLFSQNTINESDVSNAVLHLNRIIEIQKILIDQIRVLETMTAMDFLEFRDYLFPSSGFQSSQFRLIENKLGLQKDIRVNYGDKDYKDVLKEDEKLSIKKSEICKSMIELLEDWLERAPFLSFDGFDFWEKYSKTVLEIHKKEKELIKNKPNQTHQRIRRVLFLANLQVIQSLICRFPIS